MTSPAKLRADGDGIQVEGLLPEYTKRQRFGATEVPAGWVSIALFVSASFFVCLVSSVVWPAVLGPVDRRAAPPGKPEALQRQTTSLETALWKRLPMSPDHELAPPCFLKWFFMVHDPKSADPAPVVRAKCQNQTSGASRRRLTAPWGTPSPSAWRSRHLPALHHPPAAPSNPGPHPSTARLHNLTYIPWSSCQKEHGL